jgi:hypothetical protein
VALLTRAQFLAIDRPAGFADLAAFLVELRAGRIPRTPAMERIAAAFERVLEGRLAPGEIDSALGLRRHRGRREMTAGEVLETASGPLCQFIWNRIQRDRKRGAQARAIEAAVVKFRMDRRGVERAWSRAKPFLEADDALHASAALIREHISAEELAGPLGKLPASQVHGIALARAARTPARK